MKEYVGIALNVNLFENTEGRLRAAGELVIIVSEPRFSIDQGGEMIKRRDVEDYRFQVTSRTLAALIESLKGYLDHMVEFENRASLRETAQSPTKDAESS